MEAMENLKEEKNDKLMNTMEYLFKNMNLEQMIKSNNKKQKLKLYVGISEKNSNLRK